MHFDALFLREMLYFFRLFIVVSCYYVAFCIKITTFLGFMVHEKAVFLLKICHFAYRFIGDFLSHVSDLCIQNTYNNLRNWIFSSGLLTNPL